MDEERSGFQTEPVGTKRNVDLTCVRAHLSSDLENWTAAMTSLPLPLTPLASPANTVERVDLRCFTYGDRAAVLDDMLYAMSQSGCWLESRRATSASQVEIYFGAMLGAMDEIYGGLVGAGVEMPRDSHRALTWLCTLRRHRKDTVVAMRTVSIRMEMSFLTEAQEEMGFVSGGMA